MSTPLPGRNCDDCALCCKLPTIPALEKPEGQWCRNCSTRKTCDAYETRPEPCRDFFCLFMRNANLDEAWRPTNARFLITTKPSDGGEMMVVMVDPARPDAWRREPYFSNLRTWSAQFQLIISIAGKRIVLFPDHEKDFGILGPGEIIEFIGIPQADGSLHRTAQLRHHPSPPRHPSA